MGILLSMVAGNVLVVWGMREVSDAGTTPTTTRMLLVSLGVAVLGVRRSGLPLSHFGLHTDNLRAVLAEGVLLTLLLIPTVLAAKSLLQPDAPLLQPSSTGRTPATLALVILSHLLLGWSSFFVIGFGV